MATANTPVEMWPKILRQIADMKAAAATANDQSSIQAAIELETGILKHLQKPIDQMTGQAAASAAAQNGPPEFNGFSGIPAGAGPMAPLPGPVRAATNPMVSGPYGAPGNPGSPTAGLGELAKMLNR